jgi:hypothetical protein
LHTLHHVTLPMIQIEQSCLNFFWPASVKQCTSLQLVSDIHLLFLVTLVLLVILFITLRELRQLCVSDIYLPWRV